MKTTHLLLILRSKCVLVQNLLYENVSALHENKHVGEIIFHIKGFQ